MRFEETVRENRILLSRTGTAKPPTFPFPRLGHDVLFYLLYDNRYKH